ncbi:MAG: hypothetical protein MJA82_15140 [Clostridia bacterium]|nr:hypothetical protein [Clostridia bacterium]
MALGDYDKTIFVNGGPPGISAERLNNNEDKTQELDSEVQNLSMQMTNFVADTFKYQTPVIVGTQIRLNRQSNTKRLFFYLSADLNGGNITISLDDGASSKNLKDIDNLDIAELPKGFIEIVDNATFFTYAPRDALKANVQVIGANRLYHCNSGNPATNYELNSDTLAIINAAGSPSISPSGIGGIGGRLYNSDDSSDEIYELNPNTLAAINTVRFNNTTGIGGIRDRLYSCVLETNRMYELNPNTVIAILGAFTPSNNAGGIGGIVDRLYHCDRSVNEIYELNPDTLTVINTVSSPSFSSSGIGGINNRLYHCDFYSDKMYELNPDTLAIINTVSAPNTGPRGIGGMKTFNNLIIKTKIKKLETPVVIDYLGVKYVKQEV